MSLYFFFFLSFSVVVFSGVLSIQNFSYCVHLLTLFVHTQFLIMSTFTPSFVPLHLRLLCFSYAVPPIWMQRQTIVAQCLKLTSLNVKGLINFRKRRTILLCCRKRKEDLVFLQETHSIAATENLWRNESGTEMISYHYTSNYYSRGVLKVLTQYYFVNPVCNCF